MTNGKVTVFLTDLEMMCLEGGAVINAYQQSWNDNTFVTFSDRCIQKFCGGYKAKSAKILRILASDSVACMLPVYYFSWLNQDLHGINVHIKCNWFLCIQFFSYDAGCCGAHDCCRWGKSCTSYSTTWCYMKYDTQKWRKVQKVDGRNK